MSTSKHIDKVCAMGLALALVLTLLFLNGEALGLEPASQVMGYEARLFDTSRVHTVDLVVDHWEDFLETCEDEEYVSCAVVIDGEGFRNVGLRAKGNTSLSTVSSLGSDRYSFKLEFDQYDTGKTYYGLDKLCLNNLIQDNTMLKDYLTYRMMAEFGVAAPLCSFVFITVNGEDWGLYLAVEGVEDSFLQRNYGTQHGELYKPDSTGVGGGRGNGRDFNMENLDFSEESFTPPDRSGDLPQQGEGPSGAAEHGARNGMPDAFKDGGMNDRMNGGMGGGMGGGIGSDDIKLKYSDDDPDSYASIFDSAKTDVSKADQVRLIQALKALNEGAVEEAVDIEAVLRYFVVHNFVVNGDSYTGSIVHNYYLYEEDGLLSMIPWDYNLAFGTFQGNNAATAVNDRIDAPLSVTGSGDRPMAEWIFSSQAYTEQYHQYFAEFLNTVDPAALIDEAYALIAPYVERDPTKFCTYEEFETGVQALKAFCALRAESVSLQLAGENGQVDASGLSLSDMGTMAQGGGAPGAGRDGGQRGGFGGPGQANVPGESNAPVEAGEAVPAFGPAGGEADRMRFPGGAQPEENVPAGAAAGAALVLLAASVLILAFGLLGAACYRRFGRTSRWRL